MVLGLVNFGDVKKFKDQYLSTRFFVLLLPLAPISGVFVTKSSFWGGEKGFKAKINSTSVLKVYLSVILAVSIFVFLLGGILIKEMNERIIYFAIAAISLIALRIANARLGKTTPEEEAERELYYTACGLSALPEYLAITSQSDIKNHLIADLAKKRGNDVSTDPMSIVKSSNYDNELLPLLFAIMGYVNALEPSTEHADLYNKIKQEYKSSLGK